MSSIFEKGFILLYRTLLDNEVFQNERWLKVFIWCLLKANHEDKSVSVITGRGRTAVKIKRGTFIFGRHSAAKELSMKPSGVWYIMQKLVKLQICDIQTDSHYSIVTIVNYNKYQVDKEERLTGKLTGNKQATDTNNNDNNDNNEEEVNYISSFQKFWKSYPRKKDKQTAEKAWMKLSPDAALVEKIIAYIEEAKKSPDWTNSNGQYIPYPAKFINNRRWEDQPGPPGEEKGEHEKPNKYDGIGKVVNV